MRTDPVSTADLALVLTGGGARGAYQVGLLRCLARRFPDLRIPIITGVSAGAVNAVQLAAHHGTFPQAVTELAALWSELTPERVFRVDVGSLGGGLGHWLLRLVSGGALHPSRVKGLVDTAPLREFLEETLAAVRGVLTGIDYNLERGVLRAVALTATNYATGQSTVFVQGKEFREWRRPQLIAERTRMRVEHVMASAALPIFFPAIRVGDAYYGDGGIRATAPLSPAMHLGARRILAVSTRFHRPEQDAATPAVAGYPPPAQVVGVLMNALFLDMMDQDMLAMERINHLIDKLAPHDRGDMRPIRLLAIRPSQDLARLAGQHEPHLPRAFRYLTRGLGTRETGSPDLLSMLMFQPDYLRDLMDLGEKDAEDHLPELEALLGDGPP